MNNDKNSNNYLYYLARINIKKYRKLANMTTEELAYKTGYTHQYILDLECIEIIKRPRLDTLGEFVKAFDIDIRQLFDAV